jgi:hypothetical protein
MKERDVITLDEGLDYLIVKEFEFEGETYYLAMGIDEENTVGTRRINIPYSAYTKETK